MKKIFLGVALVAITLASCTKVAKEETKETTVTANEQTSDKSEIYEGFVKDSVSSISDDLFMINKRWMVITAGDETKFNSMTASWGGFGTVWEVPVAFMTVRNTRYTFEFLQKDSVYTLTFFDDQYKDKMQLLGSKSGRDTDKIKESGLIPVKMPSGAMSYKEASMVIECKKLINQPLEYKNMKDQAFVDKWYKGETHNLFFGEIIGVWKKAK